MLSVVYYVPSCDYKIVAFRLHVLTGTPLSDTSAIYTYALTKLFLQQCVVFSVCVCVIQFLQPHFQWASTPVTLMSSLCSETLQHLCSSRAIAACCLLPLRLATLSLIPLLVGTRYKMHVKVRPQNASWLPKWKMMFTISEYVKCCGGR